MNTGAKIAVVSVIIAAGLIIVGIIASIAVGSIASNRDAHNQECLTMHEKINNDKTGLKAALGLNTDAINQEIDEYNAQCT